MLYSENPIEKKLYSENHIEKNCTEKKNFGRRPKKNFLGGVNFSVGEVTGGVNFWLGG